MPTPISTLAVNVQSRLEEFPTGAPGTWWSLSYELYSALAEAENDLMLLVGRPTQIVQVPLTLTANTVWQSIPKGYFQITDITSGYGALYKINLYDLDYLQTYWGPNWEQDVGPTPREWAPIGFNLFVIHPAPVVPITVNVTAIQYPLTDVWPYTGSETVVFPDEMFVALEVYAAHYARIKELGAEFQQGVKLYQEYLKYAQRYTALQDRRDPLIFSMGFGASGQTNPMTQR